MTPTLVLGITGKMASGKTAATRYITDKYDAESFRFSTMLRDVLDRIHQEHTRDNLQTISYILRQNFGEDVMARTMAEDVKRADHDIVVVEGVRRPADIAYLRELDNFVLISLEVDLETRYERITARTENIDDHSKTFAQFQHEQDNEAERQIDIVAAEADEHINNSGSLTDLHTQLDDVIKKYAGENRAR